MKLLIALLTFIATLPSAALAGTAVVNSPGDGFLAMRSEPSTSRGVRLHKIPHATPLALGECVSTSKAERWCKTTFQGQSGWVLDRFLSKETGARSTAKGGSAEIPAKGDGLRSAILDAIRTEYPRPVVFDVLHLKASGNYAWAVVRPKSADGREGYEDEAALLQKRGGVWRKVDGLDLGAACDADPCVDTDQAALQRRHPDAPAAIFR